MAGLDPTTLVGIALIVGGVLLVIGFLAVSSVTMMWWMRRRRRPVAAVREPSVPAPAPAPAPVPAQPPAAARPEPPSAPPAAPEPLRASKPPSLQGGMTLPPNSVPPSVPPRGTPPPPPPELQGRNLLGFFDDELRAGGVGAETARTELFQRGAHAYEFDDDEEDEEGATEVFSAHHADELMGDFDIDDEEPK